MTPKILMTTSSSCKVAVIRLSLNCMVNELVSDSMNGSDVHRPRRIRFQLGAEPSDMIVHGACDWIRLEAPDFVQQFVASDHLAHSRDKQSQDGELLASHLNRLSAAPRNVPEEI